jgi:hypothetical protein
MKTLYVYSTLAADVMYQNHAPGGADIPRVVGEVLIKGGAGVANDRLVTPRGVATKIDEHQLAMLRENSVFKIHEENGYVAVSEHETDADNAAADMTGRDNSAPIVPQDLRADEQPMGSEDTPAPAPTRGRGKRR